MKEFDDNGDDDSDGSSGPTPKNKDRLLVYATCISADMTFTTDLKFLKKARGKNEKIIDILNEPSILIRQTLRTYWRINIKRFYQK